jgi:hypothetical protein
MQLKLLLKRKEVASQTIFGFMIVGIKPSTKFLMEETR